MLQTSEPRAYVQPRRSSEDVRAARQSEILETLHDHVEDQMVLLADVDKIWQPTDFLPDSSEEDWFERVAQLRAESAALPDDVVVTLVGDMITEEALPSYMTMLNRLEGIGDESGEDQSAWARWSRGWTAEENRHGDLLNRFLYLIGRVDMRAIEVTIHNLIKNGFNADMDNDPYKGFLYTSFQERATKISHANVAKLAKETGNKVLNRICQAIAGDEARHEEAYKRFMDKIFEIDTSEAVIAFRDMMKRTIQMPARLMEDGSQGDLFKRFSSVAERLGVYTAFDYADIMDNLVERWNVPSLEGLRGEAAKAQDYLATLGGRYRRLAERLAAKAAPPKPMPFRWVFDRAV